MKYYILKQSSHTESEYKAQDSVGIRFEVGHRSPGLRLYEFYLSPIRITVPNPAFDLCELARKKMRYVFGPYSVYIRCILYALGMYTVSIR